MISPKDLRDVVVRPTLAALDKADGERQLETGRVVPGQGALAAEQLLMGTILAESVIGTTQHLRQLADGPARGIWQIEPATHLDIHRNWLNRKPEILAVIESWGPCTVDALMYDLRYGCAIARQVYRRVAHRLPQAGDYLTMADYWKRHYNTAAGAGVASTFAKRYKVHVQPLYEGDDQ